MTKGIVIGIAVIAFILFPLGIYMMSLLTANPPIDIIEDTMSPTLPPPPVFPPVPPDFLRVFSPNGGETLCSGQGFPIQWEAGVLNINSVDIELRTSDGLTYAIGTWPSSRYGVYQWTVGGGRSGTVPNGTYAVVVRSGESIDVSDSFFTIKSCQ